MTIILAICIPVTALVTGFFTLKGVHMGLKWQYEIKHEEKPVMNITEPIQNLFYKDDKKESEPIQNIMDEWLNGAKEQ